MRKYDYFWMTNEEWYHTDEYGNDIVNDDAPKEAKESYERYRKQKAYAAERVRKGLSMD